MLETNLHSMANYLGILSSLGFALAFFSLIANISNYKFNNRVIFTVAHGGLIISIFSGLVHGLLMAERENINFYDFKTYWIYAEGLLTFNLLTFFSFSFTEFKLSTKKIIYFTYALLFLISCHLWVSVIYLS